MLEIKNLTKIFNMDMPEEDWKVALDNISITINDGDFVTVIGGNGSGKSTLLNLIAGVYKQTSGEIIIDGVNTTDIDSKDLAHKVSRVFQDPKLGTAGNMSIVENLELAIRRGKRRGIAWGFKKENEEIFKNGLKRFNLGLEDRLEQKVLGLSGGQRQALTLLMATLEKPDILLLDEHTAALDPKTAKKVLTLTEEIVTENHLTTIMITHNMRDALRLGNRLVMMYNGHIIMDVTGEEKKKLTVEDLYDKFEEMDSTL